MTVDPSVAEFARMENIEITGTRSNPDSDFDEWLQNIDLHADVVENSVGKVVSDLSPEAYAALNAEGFGKAVRDALSELSLQDNGKPYGTEVQALSANFADRSAGTELPDH